MGLSVGLRRRAARSVSILGVALCLATGLSVAPSRGEVVPTVPAHVLAFGAHPYPRPGQSPEQALAELESQVGRKLEVVRDFEGWESVFPSPYHEVLKAGHRTMILSIRPRRANGSIVPLAQIAQAAPGSTLDQEMRSWARRIRDYAVPIYVTLHHEPETSGAQAFGNAADFIAAWRHWVEVFRQERVNNARFMWIMTDYSMAVAPSAANYAGRWYPGDDWVDSMGTDSYNWYRCRPTAQIGWMSLETIADSFRRFGALHPTKPLWLTEWGSVEDPAVPGRRADWFDQARALFARPEYGQFVGISYFNYSAAGDPCVWRVDSPADALARFAAMANDPLYSGSGAFEIEPPVDPPPPPVDQAPTAVASVSCDQLDCSFDASGSSDDGTITSYAWGFGDGQSGSGVHTTHTYGSAGPRTVTLTVTDDGGQSDQTTVSINPSTTGQTQSTVEFVATAESVGNRIVHQVSVPGSVAVGDAMVLLFSANVVATTYTGPAGWTPLESANGSSMVARAWTKTATAADLGATVTVGSETYAKSDLTLAAYRGTDPTTAVAVSQIALQNTNDPTITSPAVNAPAGSNKLVTYWANKSGNTTAWTLPSAQTTRAGDSGSGGGHISTTLAENNAAVTGTTGGLSATANGNPNNSVSLSIVLRPGTTGGPGDPPPPPVDQAPTAVASVSCDQLDCSFDASGSSDDGTITSYAWGFGDGQSGSGVHTTHTYGSAGPRTVTLTVTDDGGQSDQTTVSINPSTTGQTQSTVEFVATAESVGNRIVHQVSVPGSVAVGDAMVLLFSANVVATTYTGPAGWTPLESANGSSMVARAWTKTATAADLGATVTVGSETYAKSDLTLAAYRGTDPTTAVAVSQIALQNTNDPTITSPAVNAPAGSNKLVTYWANKSGNTTAWTLPSAQTTRAGDSGSGGGHISTTLAENNAAVTGTTGGLSATANGNPNNSVSLSIVLRPGTTGGPGDPPPPPGNTSPTADFSFSCTGHSCSFTSGSTDSDGLIADSSWAFGDGATAQGAQVDHVFGAAATYPVTLTVTDDDGGTDTAVRGVVVTDPGSTPISFVATAASNLNATVHRVVVPGSVQAGDALLLALSINTSASVGTPTGLSGWQLLGSRSAGQMSTQLWSRVAPAGSAGTTVSVPVSVISKGNLVLAAYRGTSTTDPVAAVTGASETVVRTTHATPGETAADGSWVVWYWAHKDSATTALLPPSGVTVRSSGTQSGSGRVTGLLADSGGPVGTGAIPAQVATAAVAKREATMWSVVLAPR